ncbi:MAG: dihydrolipoyl dehydrogenase [Bacillota bacterium]
MEVRHYQLTIIGGGPGGYTTALKAAALGLKTLLIEKESLGGTCLNHGCIPTKVLTNTASIYQKIKRAEEFGFTTGPVGFSFQKIQARKAAIVKQLTDGLQKLLKGASVEVWHGDARTVSPSRLAVKLSDGAERYVTTDKLVLATGSEEILPSLPGLALPGVITSREALALEDLPPSLAVIGGGVIALEMASIFASFGCAVTIVHRSERLLRRMDLEMVRRLAVFLRRKGIDIKMNTPLQKIEPAVAGLLLTAKTRSGEESIAADKVLISIGRKACFGNQDLDALKLMYSPQGIGVNEYMETNIDGVYAVGDVTAPGYFLAHVATHQGLVAAQNAAGKRTGFHGSVVPMCLFTDPELAGVGLTEEEAREKGYAVKTGKFPFSGNGKAVTQGEEDGLVKLVSNAENGVVLGVHILGPHASDLIQEGTLAVSQGVKVSDLADLIHPHPTLSEAVWEASLAVTGAALHFR